VFLFWLKLYLRTVAATWQTFGLARETLVYAVRRPLLVGLVRVTFALDNVFFPGCRRVVVRKPVFIVGHPRSGTTFLHHLLTRTREFCAFEAWEIFLPSLVARTLLRRLIARLVRQRRATTLAAEMGHEVVLDEIEEDEILLLHNGNTQLSAVVSPLGFSDWDFTELVYADAQPDHIRRKTTSFLKRCFQRQIYWTRKTQVVAKLTYSGTRIRSLLEAFPDAKIVYVVRSPFETIPSHLTMHRNLFDHLWGLERIPEGRLKRYYERRYRYDVAYYRYLEDLIAKGELPPAQFMVLPYDELRENPAAAVGKVAEFAGLRLSRELQQHISAQSRQQKTYRRRHTNLHLEEFGLTEARVREDLAFVFDKYGFEQS
jgi:hypothetical protein